MKRLVLTFVILASFALGGMAQDVWKTIGMDGEFLGVSANGDMFCDMGYDGLFRSQDEGATWEALNVASYVRKETFMINEQERIFVFNENTHKLCFSDDNGSTWQEQTSGISTNWPLGMFSLSNDTIFIASIDKFFWTLDGGELWNETPINFIDDAQFGSILADHAGNVYVSTYSWTIPVEHTGIYTATMDDLTQWTVKTQGGARDMAFDSEGNILAASLGTFLFDNGVYFVNADRFALASNDVIFAMKRVDWDNEALFYSTDHGETYTQCSNLIPSTTTAPDPDLGLFKGRDNHLYCHGDVWEPEFESQYYKSVQPADEISIPLNGILTRVPTPYFEQNACDTRLAIVSGEETFYVTVDGFWPNPNLDALIIHYDTIPIGTAIDVSGTIKTMSDELGNPFYVIDIQETTAHYYDAITSMLKGWPEEYVYIQPTVSPSQIYYLTINGERQTWPLVFNGVTYEDFDLLTFIGHCSIQTDSIGNEFMGMELQDIQPFRDYTFELEDGTLSTNYWNPLYLSAPFEDQHFLTFLWGDFTFPSPFYPMHNGQFYKGSFINNDIFREGMHVDLKGIEHIRYDIYGSEVNTVEIVEMDTEEETTLTGTVEMAPIPNTGNNPLPVPGVMVAFKANERTYYLENPQDYSGSEWFLVGNDTIYSGQEITATFTSKMLIDNGLNFYYRININEAEVWDEVFPPGSEWYYEIQNDNGSITYQYMFQAGDTIINDEPTHILVKINTLYDKDLHQDVTHEYVYERDGKVYWWNKTLEEFTVLYDFGAHEGDSWTIKVGTETLDMHVDAVEEIEYEGSTYRMLHVSDPEGLFSGDIVCGIGHLTSFFPERLMDNGDGVRVEGLRCYWVDDELVFKYGDEDCDAIYEELHGIEEDGHSTGSGTLMVYPNPTDGTLFVQTLRATSLPDQTYHITNLMGQTVLSGNIDADNQQIDVSSLPQGMYFITVGEGTRKFVVNR